MSQLQWQSKVKLCAYIDLVISVVGILGSIVYAIYLIATRGFHVSFFENHLVNSTTNGTNYNSGNVEWTWSDIGWDWMYGVVVVLYVILLCFRIQFTLNLLRTCGWNVEPSVSLKHAQIWTIFTGFSILFYGAEFLIHHYVGLAAFFFRVGALFAVYKYMKELKIITGVHLPIDRIKR